MERVILSPKDEEEYTFEEKKNLHPKGRERAKFKFNQWYARSESFLSTNAFVIAFLVSYIHANLLMFFWGAREEYIYTKVPVMRWFISIARGFGYILNLNCGLVVLLASRLAFTVIRDTPLNLFIPFDKSFPSFHIVVGYVIVASVCGHGIFHLIWIIKWNGWGGGLWGINMCVATGLVLATILMVMLFSSISSMRRDHFEIFYYIHIIGASFFFGLLLIHGVFNGKLYTYKWIIAPLVVYVIDRFVRRRKVVNSSIHLSEKNSVLKGANVLQLKLPKQFEYKAGQYAEVKVKSINQFEWHPFTISSAPIEDNMCFYVKALGDWTEKLRDAFQERIDGQILEPLEVHIRGPYGAPAQHVRGYQRIVLISGGVGATPFCSICKDLYTRISQIENLSDLTNGNDKTKDVNADYSSEQLIRADKEIMVCVNRIYSQNVYGFDDGLEEEDDDGIFSLNELFAATNDYSEDPGSVLPSMKNVFNTHEESHNPMPLPDDIEACVHDMSKWGRDSKTELSNGVENISRKKTQIDGTRSINRPFHQSALWIDSIDKAKMIRDEVIVSRLERALNFLHTIGVNLVTFMVMLTRIIILAYASIFGKMNATGNAQNSPIFSQREIVALDLSLGGVMIVLLTGTLALEMYTYRWAFFVMRGRVIDLCLLLPLTVLSVSSGIYALLEDQDQGHFFISPEIHFFAILPSVTILLIYRLHRVIGSRVLLADYFSESQNFGNIGAIDFIWTMPYEEDDDWLREELVPLANGNQLRLHRFITRQNGVSQEKEKGFVKGMSTRAGRPNWEELLQNIARKTPSNAKVGIFFCGPKGMSKAIRETIMKVQVLSNLRGKYLGTSSDENLATELRLDGDPQLQKIRSRGSNIRFVFREENFG